MDSSEEALLERADASYRRVCDAERDLLGDLLRSERRGLWKDFEEATGMAHWVSLRYGISNWKAERWMLAAHALESLPAISAAFHAGHLGIDRVVELTRLATASRASEASLLDWALRHSSGAIRARADEEIRWSRRQVETLQARRSLTWRFDDEGRRLAGEFDVPAADGAVILKAIERQVSQIPVVAGEGIEARRADALVLLASARIAEDPDQDRATIVLHARAQDAAVGAPAVLEGGGVIDGATVERLGCHARVQTVHEDAGGNAIRMGRLTRVPSAPMLRQLRYRDRDCQFPSCVHRRFTNAHHIVHWARGGATDLENLVLLCTAHHKLVHEHGWGLKRTDDGTVDWFRPNGQRYRAGPAPPRVA